MPRIIAFSWEVFEYELHERGTRWYALAGIVVGLLIVYSFWTHNILFGILVVLTAVIIFLRHYYAPQKLLCEIDEIGIHLDGRLYDFNNIEYFRIAQRNDEKYVLYIHRKKGWHPEFPIVIHECDPHDVRLYLLNFIDEHEESRDENGFDRLARFLKL